MKKGVQHAFIMQKGVQRALKHEIFIMQKRVQWTLKHEKRGATCTYHGKKCSTGPKA
jgi:hypothetical protein